MYSSEPFGYFILYTAIFSVVSGVYLSVRARKHDGSSTSSLGASSKSNFYIFASSLTVIAALSGFGVYGYMRLHTNTPDIFYWLYAIALVNLLVTAWVPFTHGWKFVVHRIASWYMAYSMMALGAIVLINEDNKHHSGFEKGPQMVGFLILLAMIGLLVWTRFESLSNRQRLRIQQAYILLFVLLLTVRVYL